MSAPEFTITDAVRSRVHMIISIIGPSGSGKTLSSLLIALGLASIDDGPIIVIDTENHRARHYAPTRPGANDGIPFKHLPFVAPYAPKRYIAALRKAETYKPSAIVIDSISHEHNGLGGVLSMHHAEVEKRGKESPVCWVAAKKERDELLQVMLELNTHLILCFRAKEKSDWQSKKGPEPLGWMPIGGEEYAFESTLRLLFVPGSDGRPLLVGQRPGERAMIKTPRQFRQLVGYYVAEEKSVDREFGAELARWARGDAPAENQTPAPAPAPQPQPGPAQQPEQPTTSEFVNATLAAFDQFGITAQDLIGYLGCDLTDALPEPRKQNLYQVHERLLSKKIEPGHYFPRHRKPEPEPEPTTDYGYSQVDFPVSDA